MLLWTRWLLYLIALNLQGGCGVTSDTLGDSSQVLLVYLPVGRQYCGSIQAIARGHWVSGSREIVARFHVEQR